MEIEITVDLHAGLTDTAKLFGIDRGTTALRSIEIAQKLGSALKIGHEIYHQDKLVPIPLPRRGAPFFHMFNVPYTLEAYRGLNEVKKIFKIEYGEVVEWGLDRMPDIVDRLMYGAIFIVSPSGPEPLTLSWIHSKQPF